MRACANSCHARLLGLEAAIQAAIAADQRHEVTARWVEGAIACRNFRPEYAFYAKRAAGSASGTVDARKLFATVCTIGGADGWFYADALWNIRRAFDWVVGGPSMRRSRRHPTALRVGDVVDSWRVIALEPDRRLTLMMEMRGPGAGVLEFVVRPDDTDRVHRCCDGLLAPRRSAGLAVLVRAGAGARASSSRG